MKSLQELLERGKLFGVSDLEVIQDYLTQDGMSSDAIDVVIHALRCKIIQIETQNNYIKANMNYSFSYYYKQYDFDTAEKLDTLTRTMMLDFPFTEEQISWMKDFKLKSGPFWHDLAEVINAVQDSSYEPKIYGQYSHLDSLKSSNTLDEINDDTDDDSLLTSDERAYILTLITKTLQANDINLEVAGYEDCDGVYFNIMLDKADEHKPAVEFLHADSSKLPEGWEATT